MFNVVEIMRHRKKDVPFQIGLSCWLEVFRKQFADASPSFEKLFQVFESA